MTELDLLLIRQREHEIEQMRLRLEKARLSSSSPFFRAEIMNKICALEDERDEHAITLERKGYDYFTITAEMARIRAEVRGEK